MVVGIVDAERVGAPTSAVEIGDDFLCGSLRKSRSGEAWLPTDLPLIVFGVWGGDEAFFAIQDWIEFWMCFGKVVGVEKSVEVVVERDADSARFHLVLPFRMSGFAARELTAEE